VPELLERLREALAGRYSLERELGQGGMATVYLAEDVKHHRKVALKVLRPELSAALGSERFLREIETTAQLTHPHILPLLDSGTAEGTLFYVMPFVEGESLRDRLSRETQLPLEDALRIAREAADALAYAHSHGVIHRDIKPENILLKSGHAVVADFGIARAVSAAGGERLTETGLAVGTPAYMSPEQAAGSGKLDGRSDVYSLGYVLFEMLSGETPYTGPTPQSILAKKLSEPLPRISVVREAVAPGIEAALNKALARTPADRWPTAADFAAALAHPDVLTTPGGGTTPTQARPIIALGNVPLWGKWATGVAAVAIVALVATQLFRSEPLNITVSDIAQVTSDPGVEFEPAISPGGDEVAYVAGPYGLPRLFVRSTVDVTGGGAVRLGDTAPGSEWLPAWSPDGQRVQFWNCPGASGMALGRPCAWRETGKLGGTVQPVAPRLPAGTLTGWGVAFSPDSTLVAFLGRRDTTEGEDTLYVAPAIGSGSRRALASGQQLHSPAFSPDGARIAYVHGNYPWRTSTNAGETEILVVDAAGGPRQLVSPENHLNVSPVWLDARHLLYVSDRDGERAVYVVEVGPNGARGEPRAISGLSDPHSISYSAASQRLAYSKFSIQQNIWSYPLGGSAPLSIRSGRPVTTGTQVIETHDPSPDGRWIAYSGILRGRMHLFKVPAGGGQPVLLTNYPGHEELPRWSPDGREIAFFHGSAGENSIEVIPAEGGAARRAHQRHEPPRLPGLGGDRPRPLLHLRPVGNVGRAVAGLAGQSAWAVARGDLGLPLPFTA
jgi:Tol biopolymer transport system component/tRNA A-37 threonylcarbamoyl transferase component Bud32